MVLNEFLQESIHYAQRITSEGHLVRMDSAYDSLENLKACHAETNVNYFIKVNLRGASKESWLRIADDKGIACEQRPARVNIGFITFAQNSFDCNLRQVFQVIVRTIDRDGQLLLFPDIEVNVYWTSLNCSPWRVIELYRDHGTSEQFHSELKTDLDLERLPAGKFDTNKFVLHAGVFACNLLSSRDKKAHVKTMHRFAETLGAASSAPSFRTPTTSQLGSAVTLEKRHLISGVTVHGSKPCVESTWHLPSERI